MGDNVLITLTQLFCAREVHNEVTIFKLFFNLFCTKNNFLLEHLHNGTFTRINTETEQATLFFWNFACLLVNVGPWFEQNFKHLHHLTAKIWWKSRLISKTLRTSVLHCILGLGLLCLYPTRGQPKFNSSYSLEKGK